MTEEKKEVYEIKKESVKQFLLIAGGVFVGCFMAIILAGQLVKPKAPCPCVRAFISPPCHQMYNCKHFSPKFEHRRDRMSHQLKKQDGKFEKLILVEKKDLKTPTK